jgi:DNA-directed RNA polymerase subunit N (RpoN/RPB10)
MQWTYHNQNKVRQDRKEILDELDFVWSVDSAGNYDKQWRQQYERLVEFQQKNGHCIVPCRYEQDKSLGQWINNRQRTYLNQNKMRQDRKEILDELGFVWSVDSAGNNDKQWHLQH